MKYRIVDENGEIQAEFDTSEKWLPRLLERLMSITTLSPILSLSIYPPNLQAEPLSRT